MKRIILGAGIVIVSLTYLISGSYYEKIFKEIDNIEEAEKVYQYQFDMIVENSDSTFWQAVYESGKEAAEESNALLNLKGSALNEYYSKIDYMKMSIAAKADGIILEYKGEAGLDEMIEEAISNDIPVITVMSDAPHSRRQSFVGINDYQLGTAYAEQVCNYVDDTTETIMVLQRKNNDNIKQSTICSEISKAVLHKMKNIEKIKVEEKNLLSLGTFEVEETVRDIFQRESGPPDILVCMDEEITECARQVLIDYNLAGKVTIIGYYTSESILDAVEKGLIAVTCDIDTEQMGKYSVNALSEFLAEGRVSSYCNVDIEFLDMESVRTRKMEKIADEEDKMEKSDIIQ